MKTKILNSIAALTIAAASHAASISFIPSHSQYSDSSTFSSSGSTSFTGSGKTQEEARANAENRIAGYHYTSYRVTNIKFSKDSYQHHCTISYTYERK